MSKLSLIILAAGESSRFCCGGVRKQFLRLGAEPLWLWVARRLASFYDFEKIIIASSHPGYSRTFSKDYEFTQGGPSRSASLRAALGLVSSEWVMVSDAARPLVSAELFGRLIAKLGKADCISPALRVADTVLFDETPIDREKIRLIQTPQISRKALLAQALAGGDFIDDSSALRAVGGSLCFVEGDEAARKITFAADLKRLPLPPPSSQTFTGSGFDVHAFEEPSCETRPLILGGVVVDEARGLRAHSDGDVLAHALADALLGAAGLGDIGEHFPDTDEAYKNADSMALLGRVAGLVRELGFEIINADATILAQAPKISPFKDEMREKIAAVLAPARVNIKATTTEGLGFVGRGEGLAVLASVNLGFFDWTK